MKWATADAPVRAKLRGIQTHGGFNACDWCTATATPGQTLLATSNSQRKRDSSRKIYDVNRREVTALYDANRKLLPIKKLFAERQAAATRVWPASTMTSGEERTKAQTEEVCYMRLGDLAMIKCQLIHLCTSQIIENFETLSDEAKKGVLRESPLAFLPDFDYIKQMPIDIMHAMDLGVTKAMAGYSIQDKAAKRVVLPAGARVSVPDLNVKLNSIRVPKEFRTTQEYDHANWKATEVRTYHIKLRSLFTYVQSYISI